MKNILALCCLCVLAACSKDKEVTPEQGYDYFPVETGRTWIYHVDSIAYDDNNNSVDTFTFEYKQVVGASYADDEGKTAWIMHRYFRPNDTVEWHAANNWIMQIDNLRAQQVQENTRFVKMIFPLSKRSEWNGNMYNALDPEYYTYEYLNEPGASGNFSFDKTLRVNQSDINNAIEEIVRYEVYAKGVGMIYFLSDSINTQSSGSRGYRYRLTLTSYQP